jgi:hypothetical protein
MESVIDSIRRKDGMSFAVSFFCSGCWCVDSHADLTVELLFEMAEKLNIPASEYLKLNRIACDPELDLTSGNFDRLVNQLARYSSADDTWVEIHNRDAEIKTAKIILKAKPKSLNRFLVLQDGVLRVDYGSIRDVLGDFYKTEEFLKEI